MKAKEMFEELDEVLNVDIEIKDVKSYGIYKYVDVKLNYSDSCKTIEFNGFNKTYSVSGNIDTELHQAITQQMKELGWL